MTEETSLIKSQLIKIQKEKMIKFLNFVVIPSCSQISCFLYAHRLKT